jgi:queuine tRNA-ribosyltransferase
MKATFTIICPDGRARAGVISTPAGDVPTPAFMPVGTAGAVKNLTPEEVRVAGAHIILANTYHLILRPGIDVIEEAGGIGRFMGWDGPVLTDSGGFQVFSLARIRKISEEGVSFNSHIDGAPFFLTPESVLEAQRRIRSTIAMPLDVCPPGGCSGNELAEAVGLTTRWLDRTLAVMDEASPALFGIFQGGSDVELRRRHLEEICARDIDGVAMGGLSVGEEKEVTRRIVETLAPVMPAEKPRYLMGMGRPEDILHALSCGVDMFDCVFPTRCGRHGLVLTSRGSYTIRHSRWERDGDPLEAGCECPVCGKFDRRYLRHLFKSGEALGGRLLSLHNLTFYFSLVRRARSAIMCYKFDTFLRKAMDDLKEHGG